MSSVVMMSTPFQYVVPATSTILPARLFKAFVDRKNFLPKAVPHIVKSVENIEGNGGPGTIFKITYAEGHPYKLAKSKVDAVDHANQTYKYSVIEGDPLRDTLKRISLEIEIAENLGGGSSLNFTCIYEPKDNNSVNVEELQAGKEKTLELFNDVNAYLSEHPDAYYI